MFYSKNKKNVYPSAPQVYYIKVRCKRVYITRTYSPDAENVCFYKAISFSERKKKTTSISQGNDYTT